jgi:CRP/FNR family transcriptional regulator
MAEKRTAVTTRSNAMEKSSAKDKIAILRKTVLFGTLNDELLAKIAALVQTRQLERDQVLYSEYDEASAVYIVAAGELRSIRQSAEGREQVLSTERTGAVLAAVPVFNGGKFYSTLIADRPSAVLLIEKREMHRLCREHTELLWNLAKVLAHKVRHSAELIETLALRNVEQRVAEHIFTVAQERGVPAGEGCLVELKLTRAEIANRIGSVREVVSRAFAHLQTSGLIQLEGRRLVTVPNMRALRTAAGTRRQRDDKLASDLSSEIV